jgi:WD40 repeat protein
VRTLAWVGEGVGGVAVSPDGARVAVGPRTAGHPKDPQALVLDAATGQELHRVPGFPHVGFHPTSGHLVTSRAFGGATQWDAGTGSEIWSTRFSAPRDPGMLAAPTGRCLATAPDGSRLAIWDLRAGGIQLWNATDGTPLGVIDTGRSLVSAIDFSPDGARLAVAAFDGVTVWDVQSRTSVAWGERAPGALAVAFSPNGQWLATAENDRTVRLRDAATGREVRRFVGTALRVSVLCFSPDGTRLVTGGPDRTVRVWDVETGRELLSLPGVTEAVTGLAWDGKSGRIYALDHAVRLWGAK